MVFDILKANQEKRNNMFNFFKENRKMLIVFLVIAIVFPIIILCPSPIGIIPYETGLTIVGYGGSILGGFLTLYGVWWTIKDLESERKRTEKEKLQKIKAVDRPIIDIEIQFLDNYDGDKISDNEIAIEYTTRNIGLLASIENVIEHKLYYYDKGKEINITHKDETESTFKANILFPDQHIKNNLSTDIVNPNQPILIDIICNYKNILNKTISYKSKYTFQVYRVELKWEIIEIEHK